MIFALPALEKMQHAIFPLAIIPIISYSAAHIYSIYTLPYELYELYVIESNHTGTLLAIFCVGSSLGKNRRHQPLRAAMQRELSYNTRALQFAHILDPVGRASQE